MAEYPISSSDADIVVKLNHFFGTTFTRRLQFVHTPLGSSTQLPDDITGCFFSLVVFAQKDITRTPVLTVDSTSGITFSGPSTAGAIIIKAPSASMQLPIGKYNFSIVQRNADGTTRARARGILEIYGAESIILPQDSSQTVSKSVILDNSNAALQTILIIDQGTVNNYYSGGGGGGSGANQFVYQQQIPANTAIVNHGLGRLPSVVMTGVDGTEFQCAKKHSPDFLTTTISMDCQPFSWTATFNI